MRKLYGMLCLTLMIFVPVLAQETKTIIDESFFDNRNNWPIYKEGKTITRLENNSYTIESFDDNGSYVAKETDLDYTDNFSIESKVELAEGEDNQSFGLLFGFKNWDNYYEFIITLNGYYKVFHVDQGITTSTGWVRSEKIRKKGLPNKLKIVKINDWVGFYLNDIFTDILLDHLEPSYVNMIKAEGFAGKKIGFVTNSKMKVRYSTLVIKQLGISETASTTDVLASILTDPKTLTLINDDFSSNVNNWTIADIETSYVTKIEDGVFSFDKRNEEGKAMIQGVFIAAGRDYEVSCKTKRVSGSDSSRYGLVWGFKEWNNQQQFTIDAKGKCKYAYNVYGKWSSISGSYKPEAENNLRVSRKKDSLYFYVNNIPVIKAPDLSPAGNYAGFVIFDKQKILFDDLKITQEKMYPSEQPAVTVAEETMQSNEGPFSDKNKTEHFSKDWKPGITEYEHEGKAGTAAWNEYYLNPLDNFSISEKVKWIDGDKTSGYGLVWGHRNWDNYNEFLLAKDGHFKCTIVHDKTVITTGWKGSAPFVTGDENTLEVRRHGSTTEYYINGKFVAALPFYELYGYSDGLIIYGDQTVGIENLTVKSIPVDKPELEPGRLSFKGNFAKAQNLQIPGGNEDQTCKIEDGKLLISAQFPELSVDEEAEYPDNMTHGYLFPDVLPVMLDNAKPATAFSIETTVGLVRSYKNRGAGIRVGEVDFYVDSKGNFAIGDQKPKPIDDDEKPSSRIYRLKVRYEIPGMMYFYINGKLAGSIQKTPENRNAGPVITASNQPSEAWFDEFTVRTFDIDLK